jgi:3',5'-cyclic AMP phosphodiesterase CpdA
MKFKIVFFSTLSFFFLMNCSPYDVNRRFHESLALTQPAATSPVNPDNFSFIHITDIHVVNKTNRHLSALSSRLVSSDVFIIASGDLTDTGKHDDFIAYRNLMNNTGLPYYSAIGNHDLFSNGWDDYKYDIGPSVYSTHAGNVRIIALDSADDTLGPDQYQWLKKELAAKTESYCVVVAHYNFFSPLIIETAQSTNMEEVYGMMHMFEQYHVNYVLMGHSHIYDYRSINGVSYLVGGALKEYSANEQKYFVRLTIANGQMTHQKIAF